MQKLAEVQDENVCVKWSILPHLNVKKGCDEKVKEIIMKLRNNCSFLSHNCQNNFDASQI